MPEFKSDRKASREIEVDLISIIKYFIQIIRKYTSLFIVLILIGAFMGGFFYYITPKQYTTNLLADSRILTSNEVISIVDSWQIALEKGDQDWLAHTLHISPALIKKIAKFEVSRSGDNSVSSTQKNDFNIEVVVTDTSVLDSLQWGIIQNLENNNYVKKRVEIQKRNLALLRRKINDEISELDSIKLSLQRLINNGSNQPSAFLTDPASINVQIIGLYERILQIDQTIEFIENIQLIKGFSKPKKPDAPKLKLYLLAGAMLGCIFSGFIILIILLKNKIRQILN